MMQEYKPTACPSQDLTVLPDNTRKAYARDWADFSRWCRMNGATPMPPSAQLISLYLADMAGNKSVPTIERRLSGLGWNYAQRDMTLDRTDRQITSVLAGIKAQHARPPIQKQAIGRDDMLAMIATLPFDLRGLRDRAILLLGYAGGLRRSEIVGLDIHRDDTADSRGWIDIGDNGALLTLNTRTGWREVEIGRGSSQAACPVHGLEQWLRFSRIDHGAVFVRTSRDGKQALTQRLSDKHVARLVKQTVLAAGIRADLPERERLTLFSSQSLRAGSNEEP